MAAGWEAGRPGFAGVRSAIAHAEMASPESLARIRALGDSVSIQIHMAYVGAQGTARPRPVRRPRRALTADPLTVPDDGIAANRSDLTIVGGTSRPTRATRSRTSPPTCRPSSRTGPPSRGTADGRGRSRRRSRRMLPSNLRALGFVEVHRHRITQATRAIMAWKVRSSLSDRMAMGLNSLSEQKKFSIRWRQPYLTRSIARGRERRGCCSITTSAPRACTFRTIQSAS